MDAKERLEKIISGQIKLKIEEVVAHKTDFKRSLYNAKIAIDTEKVRQDKPVNIEIINHFSELANLLQHALDKITRDHPNILTNQEIADNQRTAESKNYRELVYGLRGM